MSIRQTGIDPSTGGQIARPHVVEVGLYVLDDDGQLSLHSSAPWRSALRLPPVSHRCRDWWFPRTSRAWSCPTIRISPMPS
ncbi:hypothetical protein [Nesterenkonia pannonica]|uniref:hypothetical protein n=1 Tax=Nesterenkonia pannonica TaxID=1548602 RepID=UPI002164E5E0|nr:hypothetical protein [Nesterenkonia pannonica]